MKTWMRLKEMHGCHLRGFARTSYKITKQRNIRMLRTTCWLRTELWHAIWVWKSAFWSHTWIFTPENLDEVSDEHGERFHQDLMAMEKSYQGKWTWSMLADYFWTVKRVYLTPNTGESHKTVSWARKVLFCTFKFLCTLKTLPDRKILYT